MSSAIEQAYVGGELELFAKAVHWKGYLARQITPYLGNRVLEVGAGLGGTTRVFCQRDHAAWVCLEPDRELVDQIALARNAGQLRGCCDPRVGTLDNLTADERFDSILYIDVLEHIEADAAELHRARARLSPGGHLVVMSPSHQWLYSPFDKAVGHFRRYTKASLRSAAPKDLPLVHLRYLDSVGLLASLANKLLLSQSLPTPGQIRLWDDWMVPVSTVLDKAVGFSFGKSILGIWKENEAGPAGG